MGGISVVVVVVVVLSVIGIGSLVVVVLVVVLVVIIVRFGRVNIICAAEISQFLPVKPSRQRHL